MSEMNKISDFSEFEILVPLNTADDLFPSDEPEGINLSASVAEFQKMLVGLVKEGFPGATVLERERRGYEIMERADECDRKLDWRQERAYQDELQSIGERLYESGSWYVFAEVNA